MTSEVFFAGIAVKNEHDNTHAKIRRLFDATLFSESLAPCDLTAIKLHFGERGSDAFISPVFVRQVVDLVKKAGGKPFLTDSNTMYLGGRSNAADHLVTAIEHGFCFAVVGAPVIICDGLAGRNYVEVEIAQKHFHRVKVAADIVNAPAMVVLSHFKGHNVAGFGGAIKNLAMGCASRAGKQDQHVARPTVTEGLCMGCGHCTGICPMGAVYINEGHSVVDYDRCTGCFECLAVCHQHAIDIDWATEVPDFTERLAEYAYGATRGKEGKLLFMNFLTRITPDCDCLPFSDTPIVPDVGILASRDPVAIDAASLDLVNNQAGIISSRLSAHYQPGGDKFRGVWPETQGSHQLEYGEDIGLGARSYTLIEV